MAMAKKQSEYIPQKPHVFETEGMFSLTELYDGAKV